MWYGLSPQEEEEERVFGREIFEVRHKLKENKERVSIAYTEMRYCFWLGLLFLIGGAAYGLFDTWNSNGKRGPVWSVGFGVFLFCYSVYQHFKHKRLKQAELNYISWFNKKLSEGRKEYKDETEF